MIGRSQGFDLTYADVVDCLREIFHRNERFCSSKVKYDLDPNDINGHTVFVRAVKVGQGVTSVFRCVCQVRGSVLRVPEIFCGNPLTN